MSSTNNLGNWNNSPEVASVANTAPPTGAVDVGEQAQVSRAPAEKKSVIDARKRVAEARTAVEAAQAKAKVARAKADEAEAKALDLEYQVADTEALAAEARLRGAKEKEAKKIQAEVEAKRKKATDLQTKATSAGVEVKPAAERKRVVEAKEAERKRKTADAEEAAAVKVEKILSEAEAELTAAEAALADVEARAAAEAKAKAEEEALEAERRAIAKAEAEAAAKAAEEAERQRAAAAPKLTEEELKAFEERFMKKKPTEEEPAQWEETRKTPSPPTPPQRATGPDIILSTVYSQVYDTEPPSLTGVDPMSREYQNRVVSFVDIPAGTVLFRGERLPDEDEDLRNFYRDFLGSIGADGRFCLPPTYNVFFYPFPYVAFGAEDYGQRFNALQMYVTRKKVTLVCMISPAYKVRGSPIGHDAFMPIMRCNKVYQMDPEAFEPILCGSTGDRKDKKLDAMSFDNCLNPYYMDALKKQGSTEIPIHGWMAIAEKDSFDIYEGKGRNKQTVKKGKNTAMGTYIKQLETRYPGKVPEVLSWMYTDQAKHRGFPEICLHPMTPHPGSETQYIDAPTMDSALNFISENSDKFVYLPLACFTASQTLDGLETDYAVTDIPKMNRKKFPREAERATDAETMRSAVRQGIERQVDAYMTRFMTEGIEIPGVGLSKIVFDPRTGFYVVDSFVRRKNPMIQDITKRYEDGSIPSFPYLSILMSLETAEDRKNAMDYCIIYNQFNPQKLFNPELLYQEGPIVYRSFIFSRPPNYQGLFTNLDSKFPLNLKMATNRATFKFKRNIIDRGETLQKGFTTKELGKAPQTKRKGQRGGRHMRTRRQRRSMLEAIANENLGVVQETLLGNE